MSGLRFTLLTDGAADRALIPVLRWILLEHRVRDAIQAQWADLSRLRKRQRTLGERVAAAVDFYPCDVLFVHRDAETVAHRDRCAEIQKAVQEAGIGEHPAVCVVPVRMTEAWLLLDEAAIREAAGNPRGRERLDLPELSYLEQLPDPKSRLSGLLEQASGLPARRLKRFRSNERIHRIAELIQDFSPLRCLPAFSALEEDTRSVLRECGWDCVG